METLTASPSGGSGSGSGSGCSDGPWIMNPGFEDPTWPGAWLPSNSVHLSTPLTGSWSAELPVGAAAGGDSQLEQAIIIPSGRTFNIGFYYIPRNYGAGDFLASFSITVSLGSYDSQVFSFPGVPYWGYNTLILGPINGPSECFPVVLSFKASIVGEVTVSVPKSIQIDAISFTAN